MKPALLVAVATAALSACGQSQPPADASVPAASAPGAPSIFKTGAPETAAAGGTVLTRGMAANGKAEAQVMEATRQAGVLTVRVRFARTAGTNNWETMYGPNVDRDAVYVVAGANKLFPLTDAEERPLITPDFQLKLGTEYPMAGVWFGKFPAPPAEVKAVSLVLPKTEPLDNIPITDR